MNAFSRKRLKITSKIHAWVYRAFGGVFLTRFEGMDFLLLTTIGRTSGEKRTTPLTYILEGNHYMVVASYGGNAVDPAWMKNLLLNPRAHIQVEKKKLNVIARVVAPTEYEYVWNKFLQASDRYREYRKKTERPFPIFILEPQ